MKTRICRSRFIRRTRAIHFDISNLPGRMSIEHRVKLDKFDLLYLPDYNRCFGTARFMRSIKYRSNDLLDIYCVMYRAFNLIDAGVEYLTALKLSISEAECKRVLQRIAGTPAH